MAADPQYSSPIREWLRTWWILTDKRPESELSADASPAAAARWKDLQDREREVRQFYVVERAVFRGTVKAHLVLVFISVLFWVVLGRLLMVY